MAILRDMLVKIGFDIKDDKLKSLDSNINNTKTSLLKLTAVFTAAAGAMFGFAYSTASYSEELADSAKLIGINTDELQQLQYAAKMTDTSVEELNFALMRMSRLQAAAASGSKPAQEAFKQLGISVRNSNGSLKSTGDLFDEVADKFGKIKSTQVKAMLAFELFGRGARNIIKTLSEGKDGVEKLKKEFADYGYQLSTKQVKQGDHFIDTYRRGTTAIKGFKDMIGAALVPVVDKSMQQMIEYWKINKQGIADGITKAIPALNTFFETFLSGLKLAFAALNIVVKAVGGLNNAMKILGYWLAFLTGFKVYKILLNMISPIKTIITLLLGSLPKIMKMVRTMVFLFGIMDIEFLPILVGILAITAAVIVLVKYLDKISAFFDKFNKIDVVKKWGLSVGDKVGIGTPSLYDPNIRGMISKTSNQSKSVTNHTTVNLTVPAGSSQDQQRFLKDSAKLSYDAMGNHLAQQLLIAHPARGG